ncbi:MAG: RHS repeat protein [Proteobacteria bacterium]|nr:RHS repeat protein [Pseudomonadota bacterium]
MMLLLSGCPEEPPGVDDDDTSTTDDDDTSTTDDDTSDDDDSAPDDDDDDSAPDDDDSAPDDDDDDSGPDDDDDDDDDDSAPDDDDDDDDDDSAPLVEDCSVPGDEDLDLLADCEDDDCFGPACPEVCASVFDEDTDGLISCDDIDDCEYDAACQVELPDLSAPMVTMEISPKVVSIGGTVTIEVTSSDDIGVTTEALDVNGTPVTLIDGVGTYTPSASGFEDVTFEVQDALGNVTTKTLTIVVIDPLDNVAGPYGGLTFGLHNTTITEATDVVASLDDDYGDIYWTLEYAIADSGDYIQFSDGFGATVDEVLGTIDPTVMLDGWHDIRLQVIDEGGNIGELVFNVLIKSPLKVGNMTIEFTDLEVPMSGIPIKLRRRYDSRRRGEVGDFGYGWNLDTKSVRITKNRPEGEGWQATYQFLFPLGFVYLISSPLEHNVSIDFGSGLTRDFAFYVSPTASLTGFFTPATATGAFWSESSATGTTMIGGVGEPASVYLDTTTGNLLGGITGTLYDMPSYQLVLEDGTILVVSVENGIEEIVDPNGNNIEFTDTGIIHTAGQSILYTRDAEGRITTLLAPDGTTTTYTYDDAGNLESVTDAKGNTQSFSYGAGHFITDISNPNGARLVRSYYDDSGRLTSQCDGNGFCTDINWDPDAGEELRYDRNGYASVILYDEDGQVLEETDPVGRTVSYSWDDDGNLLEEISPSGNIKSHTYDSFRRTSTTDFNGCTDSYEYDSGSRVTQHTDRMGNVRTSSYDGQGNLIEDIDRLGNSKTFTIGALGTVTSVTDRAGNTRTSTYDSNGWKLSETDPEGNVMTWTYNVNGQRTSEVTALGTTSFLYDDDGNLIEVTANDGGVITYEYDEQGREVAMTDQLGRLTERIYDYNGNEVRVIFPDGTTRERMYDPEDDVIGEVDEDGNITTFVLDPAGQQLQVINPDGTSRYKTYDLEGRVIEEENDLGDGWTRTHDGEGNLLTETDPLGNVSSRVYDCAGRQIEATNADGITNTYEYNAEGSVVLITRAIGTPVEQTESYTYDGEGRLLTKTLGDGSVWGYDYDGNGRLNVVTDPAGESMSYSYDAVGNKLSQTDALGRSTSWTYDSMSRRTSKTTAEGYETTWTYDLGGRITSMTMPNGGTTSYTYDDRDRTTSTLYADGALETQTYDGRGFRTSITMAGDTMEWTYNVMGQVTLQTNADGSTLEYEYDSLGRQASITGTMGIQVHSIDRTYDAAGRLATVTDGVGRSATYYYDNLGNRTQVDRSNGTHSTWAYDDLNRLTQIDHFDSTAALSQQHIYTLNALGSRTQVQELDGTTVDWTYDSAHRLVEEVRTGVAARTASWVYDAVGNRIEQTIDGNTTTWLYDDDDRLLDDGTKTYTWDDNGNLASTDDTTNLDVNTWDARGKLTAVERNGAPYVDYGYDFLGHRIFSDDGADERHFLVDPTRESAMNLIETDELGNGEAIYTYGDDLVVQDRGGIRWYQKDGLGSSRALTDETGFITDTYSFGAFGETLMQIGSSPNDYLFAGEQVDAATGYYYLRARYMDPNTGRMLSEDPWAGTERDPRTLHRYMYTPGDPVNFTDPTGRSWGGLLRAAMMASFSFGIAAYAARLIVQFYFWVFKATMVTTYVLAPATQIMKLGGALGGPLGAAVSRAGACIAQWGIKYILVSYLWTFVFAAIPILGWIFTIMSIWKFRKGIMFMVRHIQWLPLAMAGVIRAEGIIRNLPDDIPRGNRFSDCVEAQSGVPARRMDAAVVRFKRDHAAGRDIQPSLRQLMDLFVPIYMVIDRCVGALQQEAN